MKNPDSHAVQEDCSEALLAKPTAHAVQFEAPPELNEPALHGSHLELSPEAFLPAGHDSQDDKPVVPAYLPASHASQDAWPVAPCDDPAGQCSHTEFPAARAKVPEEHAVHVADFAEAATKPGRQFEQEAWPEELCVPMGHEVQFDERPGENVPALQGVH